MHTCNIKAMIAYFIHMANRNVISGRLNEMRFDLLPGLVVCRKCYGLATGERWQATWTTPLHWQSYMAVPCRNIPRTSGLCHDLPHQNFCNLLTCSFIYACCHTLCNLAPTFALINTKFIIIGYFRGGRWIWVMVVYDNSLKMVYDNSLKMKYN